MTALETVRASMRALLDERAAKHERGRALVALTEGDAKRDLDDTETTELRAVRERVEAIDTELDALAAREQELMNQDARDERAAQMRARIGGAPQDSRSPASVTSEPAAYRADAVDESGKPISYFRDLYAASRGRASRDVYDRFERNDREWAGRQQRAVSTASGSADEMVPPVWMLDKFTELVRGDRILANAIGVEAHPAGTDTWSLPRMTTGTTVGTQSTQNTAFSAQDFVTGSKTAASQTKGGTVDVAIQLLDQSPLPIDSIIFADLVSITSTYASPTVDGLGPRGGAAVACIARGRKRPAEICAMTPDRWE